MSEIPTFLDFNIDDIKALIENCNESKLLCQYERNKQRNKSNCI